MIIDPNEQYSPGWWEVRRGLPTASQAKRVFNSQGKASSSQQPFINSLIAQFYDSAYGIEDDTATAAMKNGHLREGDARKAYIKHTGIEVKEVGLCMDDQIRWGASPDGLGDGIGLEIKCPNLDTFVGYARNPGKVPADYVPQIHWSMVVTGFKRWDFFAWHPDDAARPVHIEVEWNDYTNAMAEAMEKFHDKYTQAKVEYFDKRPLMNYEPPLETVPVF